jgi:hypothetical protein
MWRRAAILLMAAPAAAVADAERVMECMRANVPQTVRIQTVEVTAYDRTGGQRQLRGKLYGTREQDRVQTMLRIDAPPDLSGASYLVREGEKSDEMFLYLPAVQRVRRITGAALDGQLWGTDLSYNDLKQLQNAFSGSNVEMEPEAEQAQRPVHILSFTPRADDGSRYKKLRARVDQKTCVSLTVEFHEAAGIRKVLSVNPADLKQSGKHWYASVAEMRDVTSGTRTVVKVLGVSSGDALSRRYFNPQTFYMGN